MIFDTFDRTGQADFPFSKAVVFRALKDAVKEIRGMTIEHQDDLACRLDLKTGMSAFSWGEKMSVSVAATGDRTSAISASSGAKTIIGSATAHGKNKENVRVILSTVSNILQKHGTTWEPPLPPPAIKSAFEPPKLSVADELFKLAALRDQGILTQDEFDEQKRRLLG